MEKNKMGIQKIFPLLINMSIPPTISMLINSLYNIVDSIFVARLSSDAITAVSLAFPIQNFILALAVGTGIGINSFIARKLGEKDFEKSNQGANLGILISIFHFLIIVLLGAIFTKYYFSFFPMSKEIFDLSTQYSYIVTFGSLGLIMQVTGEKILQATGNMITPMYALIVGSIINIILDPILIYGYFGAPALGVAGAGIATVIGQIVAGIICIQALFKKDFQLKIEIGKLEFDKKILKDIYSVGIPSFFIMAISSFLVTGINIILSSFSKIAVSVFGIYFKLQTFIYMPTNGIVQGAMPLMGYNYGAKNRKRVLETLKYSLIICIIINFLGTLLFWIFPQEILKLFTTDTEIINTGINTLRFISLGYAFGSICYIISCFLQSVGKGMPSLIITLLRQLILLLPLAFIMGNYLGLNGVWLSFPTVDILTVVISYYIYQNFIKSDIIMKK